MPGSGLVLINAENVVRALVGIAEKSSSIFISLQPDVCFSTTPGEVQLNTSNNATMRMDVRRDRQTSLLLILSIVCLFTYYDLRLYLLLPTTSWLRLSELAATFSSRANNFTFPRAAFPPSRLNNDKHSLYSFGSLRLATRPNMSLY